MNPTLDYIAKKFNVDLNQKSPIEIPNTTRQDLANLFGELGYKVGVELGVEQGEFSEVLCKANPSVELHLVDAWLHYAGYRDHVGQAKLDGFLEKTKRRMAPYNCVFHRATSMEAVKEFADDSLDFVFIDANHTLKYVIEDLVEWSKKVRPGGCISGHDYRRSKRRMNHGPFPMHVVEAVNAYVQSYQIRPWFILGRKDKREGEARDSSRSYFWVKEVDTIS